jgi:hypothetical protein
LIVPAAHVMPADPSLEELMERLRPWKEIFSYFWEFPLPREGELSGREWIESSERKAWMRRRAIRRTPLYAGVDAAVRLTLGAERLLMAPNATPGPATIQQRRVIPGRGEIDAEKKRTMHSDADVREANRADVEEMTAFEKFWRRVSGDELPQTKQIRQGEMAYVGGRLLRAEGHNLMVAGSYAEGYNLMVAGRDPVLTPEEYALWLMFSHDALWTVHYPGCRELESQSPDFLLTRYLTVAIFDKIASKPLEVQYLNDVVRPYLRRQGAAAGRVLLHELSHHLLDSCRSTLEQLGMRARKGLGRNVGVEVEEHLDNCAACRDSAATLPRASSIGGRELIVPPAPAGDGAAKHHRAQPARASHTTSTHSPAPRDGTPSDHTTDTPARQSLDEPAAGKTADQLHTDTEHVYTLNPYRDRNGDPNTIGLIMVGHGADIESAPDPTSRSNAPLIETPTTVRDLSQLLSGHEYRPLEGRTGWSMTHDEGLAVYRAAQPLLHDALKGTYNTTVILEELGLVLRIGQSDTGSYDPRFGPEHETLLVISRYVRNAPQLLKVLTGRMPDGRIVDESAPILIERLARGGNLAETFRRADARTIRAHQGLILRAFANIHEQLRAMPEDHPLLDRLTPPGVARGDTGGWYLNHIDWYTENFYRRHFDRFGQLFDEFGLLRGNPFEPLIDEARSMRESRHHILHADPNEGNFLISNELHVTLLDWELAVTGPSAYDWARLGHLIPGIEVPRRLGGPDMVKFARLEKFKRVMNDTVKLAPLAAAGELTPQLIEFIDTEFSEAVIQVRQLSGHTKLLPPRAELEILRSWRP